MVDARAVAVLGNWDSVAYKLIKQNNKVCFFYLKTRALFLNGTDKLYTVCKKPLPYLMYERKSPLQIQVSLARCIIV